MQTKKKLDRDRGLSKFMKRTLPATELVNRDQISIITLLLTYRCPAACDHCVFESSPKKSETIDVEVAKKLVDAACRQSPPPVLGFSGGEPFVQLGMMKELASYASERGMPCEVVSSSAWVKSEEYARTVLSDLAERGLQTYCTSVDRFHTPFIEPWKMRTAVKVARELGLHVILNYQVDPQHHDEGEQHVFDYLAATLEMPESEIRAFQVNPLITTPVGRARTAVDDYLYPDKDFREGCPMATEVVTLSPLGFLYPCCGMVVGEDPEHTKLFIQDDLKSKSVDEIGAILDGLKHDLFFKMLQYIGPYQILTELRRREPMLVLRDKYTGACDACLEFTANPRVAQAARKFLAECRERIAAEAAREQEKSAECPPTTQTAPAAD